MSTLCMKVMYSTCIPKTQGISEKNYTPVKSACTYFNAAINMQRYNEIYLYYIINGLQSLAYEL